MGIQEEKKLQKRKLQNSFHKAFSLTGDTADYTVIEERILSGGEVKGTATSELKWARNSAMEIC